jgi:murein L,D-transpeptidase YafK
MEPGVRQQQACVAPRRHALRPVLMVLWLGTMLAVACTHNPSIDIPEAPSVTPPRSKAKSAVAPTIRHIDKIPVPGDGLQIVVLKSRRLLMVYRDHQLIHRYPIGLGFRPQGRKRWKGDGRTPEGHYAVVLKNPKSRYFLSLGLNYPTPTDALQGYREDRITWEQYQAIKAAFAAGAVPPWDTHLGGEIFIHGHGAAFDWTKGCIALDDDDMRELYGLVDVGTPVTILP